MLRCCWDVGRGASADVAMQSTRVSIKDLAMHKDSVTRERMQSLASISILLVCLYTEKFVPAMVAVKDAEAVVTS